MSKACHSGLVLLDVAERRADPALRRAGVAAQRMELGNDRRFSAVAAAFEGGEQSGTAGAHDDRIEFVNHTTGLGE